MSDALLTALGSFAHPNVWLMLGIGTLIGLWFGFVPGITGLTAVALLLPFVYSMKPEVGLPLLMAIYSNSSTGGSVSAILLNIPGTPTNAATLMDGFPMAQQGQGGRALGAAMASSGLGGAFSGLLAVGMVLLITPMIMAIGTGDLVFIILIGIAFIGVLGVGSAIRGVISGGMGLLISFIGFQAVTGLQRFTLGTTYLYDGIGLVPLSMGLFALPEMAELAVTGGAIAKVEVAIQGMRSVMEGVKDVFRHWSLALRSTIIGYIVGVIPGIGGGVAPFVAYGQAKQTSKHPEKFGTGTIEGVIAPEASNNAVVGGALLTTLALGIPGSAAMALIMGAMLMMGVTPGPEMVSKHLPLSLSLIWVVIIANLVGAILCILIAPHLHKVSLIEGKVLVPIVIAIVLVGLYAQNRSYNDVIVALVFGVLGMAMKSFGYSRPAVMLGFILGNLFEKYFFIAYAMKGPFFFMSPISLALILLLVGLFAWRPVKTLLERKRGIAA